MSMTLLLTIAAIALLLGVLLIGICLLQRTQQSQRAVNTLDRALLKGTAADPASLANRSWWEHLLAAVTQVGRRFESARIGQALLTPEDRLLLDQTNHNNPEGRATYLGIRLSLAMAFPLFLWPLLPGHGLRFLMTLLATFAAGLLLPKFALNAWTTRLRKQVEDELPLLVDLIRLLQGVGISMDQSLTVIADRFRGVMPVIGRELRDANVAYAHGRPRAQSLHRLAESFGNQDLQSLIQTIVQVHEHGGAVQEPLRQFAERLREQRKMVMKEKSGKLSVKMTLVMMVTLIPALMFVLGGPAVVSLVGTMAHMK